MLVTRKPAEPLQVPGGSVYCIPCCECETLYIGKTVQTTYAREQQHKSSCDTVLRTQNLKVSEKNDYGTAKYTHETKHKWDFDNTKILVTVVPTQQHKIRESIEIFRHKHKGIKLANV